MLTRTLMTLVVLCSFVFGCPSGYAEETVTVAVEGGAYEQSLRANWFDPFTKATGINVQIVPATAQEQITRLRAMAQSRSVAWDVIVLGDIEAHSGRVKALTENMEEFCKRNAGTGDFVPGACDAAGINVDYGLNYLVYNGDRYPNGGPTTWKDFWDVKRFPGGRALPDFNDPWRVLAVALVADGVPLNRLFPLDIERALRKLDELKPQVTMWWKTGDQSVQGFRSGQYATAMIWKSRASVLLKEGRDLRSSIDGAILNSDRAMIPNDAPHRSNAIRLLEFFEKSPQIQAKHCETTDCIPVSGAALKLMSPGAQRSVAISGDAYSRMIKPDAQWIDANRDHVLERWNAWIQQ